MDQNHNELELFQDLTIFGAPEQLDATKSAILSAARNGSAAGWSVALDDQLRRIRSVDDVIALERAGDDVAEAASLFMMRRGNRYDLTNIVPLKTGRLGRSRYNAILQDFISNIAEPVAIETGVSVKKSPQTKTMEESLGLEVARALRQFSANANKATGSLYPLDRHRWYDFIISSRDRHIDTDTLGRWLLMLGWPEDSLHDLTTEFEFGRAAL